MNVHVLRALILALAVYSLFAGQPILAAASNSHVAPRRGPSALRCLRVLLPTRLDPQEERILRYAIPVFIREHYLPHLEDTLLAVIPRLKRPPIDEDPFACRVCAVASSFLEQDLKAGFPKVRWEIRRTRNPYQGFFHDYVYSPDLDLMVDGTYRQFLVEKKPEDFGELPRIFVGSPDEFRKMMKGRIPDAVLEDYLRRTKHVRNAHQFDQFRQPLRSSTETAP